MKEDQIYFDKVRPRLSPLGKALRDDYESQGHHQRHETEGAKDDEPVPEAKGREQETPKAVHERE